MLKDLIARTRRALGLPVECSECRWFYYSNSYSQGYCMHPSSNWTRRGDAAPTSDSTKHIENARRDRRDVPASRSWDDQCGQDAKYWDPKDE